MVGAEPPNTVKVGDVDRYAFLAFLGSGSHIGAAGGPRSKASGEKTARQFITYGYSIRARKPA